LAVFRISADLLKTTFLHANFFVQIALLAPYKVVEFAAVHPELFYTNLNSEHDGFCKVALRSKDEN